jgi:hypothetical protein
VITDHEEACAQGRHGFVVVYTRPLRRAWRKQKWLRCWWCAVSVQDLSANCHGDHVWDDGKLVDLGRAKIYTCLCCRKLTFHPDREALRTRLRNWWREWCDAGIVLGFLCLSAGASVALIIGVLSGWR